MKPRNETAKWGGSSVAGMEIAKFYRMEYL